jgi:hypothetical protein
LLSSLIWNANTTSFRIRLINIITIRTVCSFEKSFDLSIKHAFKIGSTPTHTIGPYYIYIERKMSGAASRGTDTRTESLGRSRPGPFRETTVLVCGFAPPATDALVREVQAMGGNTQTRYHESALPHVAVVGSTLDPGYRVRCWFDVCVLRPRSMRRGGWMLRMARFLQPSAAMRMQPAC